MKSKSLKIVFFNDNRQVVHEFKEGKNIFKICLSEFYVEVKHF